MSVKTFFFIFLFSGIPLWSMAQTSKFSIALQTTTVETPPPLFGFANYGRNVGIGGTRLQQDYSLELLGRLFWKDNIAFRLRTGITNYNLNMRFESGNFFNQNQLTGQLEKYAVGIETSHFFGKNLVFRFGNDFQIGFFKDMIDLVETPTSKTQTNFATNTVLSLNPFFGGDWVIGRGLALGAEFRMPFERVRYREKGTVVPTQGTSFEVDRESTAYVGFGTPVSSIQLSYRF
jgi:hypothetical protein